ncbi:unnamed protein product [Candida verbasci]|uniref:Uncharacterized protein n=1 Tax=Candida verbasci TaxID=1227364 RepID=A0A9W4TTG1_9ASCO|nr:unnamed protein product [Candida verbasci]
MDESVKKYELYTTNSSSLLKTARKIAQNSHNEEQQIIYFKLIHLSIKSLLIVYKKYFNLSSDQKLHILYSLSYIIYNNISNKEVALPFIEEGIRLAKKSNLRELAFQFTLLNLEILKNKSYIHKLYDEAIEYYKYPILKLKKYELLADDLKYVKFTKFLNDDNSPLIKNIALLYLANMNITKGSPQLAIDFLNKIEDPPPLQMIQVYFAKLSAYLILNNYNDAKLILMELNKISKSNYAENFANWPKTGQVSYENITFTCLTPNDFMTNISIFQGLTYMNDNLTYSSKKFTKSLELIQSQQQILIGKKQTSKPITMEIIQAEKFRLEKISYMINFYENFISFLNGEFKLESLNKFMTRNNKGITNLEYSQFEFFYPHVYYLIALYYHSKLDIQAAKNYYLKLINLKPNPDLYLFSLLHLTILLQYENKNLSFRNELFAKLQNMFNSASPQTFQNNITYGNDVLDATNTLIFKQTMDYPKLLDDFKSTNFTFFKFLLELSHVKFQNSEIKMEILMKMKSELGSNLLDQTLTVLILQELKKLYIQNQDESRKQMCDMQIDRVINVCKKAYEFLDNNVQ